MNGSERHAQWQLLAYSVGSGVVGATVAGIMSLAAPDAARFAIWVGAVIVVSVLAGLGYGTRPVRSLWSVLTRPHRDHAGASARNAP